MRGPLAVLLCLPALLPAQQTGAPASSPARLGGYLQARVTWQKGVGMTATINRARLGATGTIATAFSYKVQGEFRTGNAQRGASVSLTDAYIRYVHHGLGIQVGQFKTPFAAEYLTSLADLETLDRSTVVDSLAPKRDLGVMADYQAGKSLTASAGVFNGEGVNTTSNRDSTVLGVGRVAFRPVSQVTVGLNLARWFGDSLRYGGDLTWQDARFLARGEFIGQKRDSLASKDDWGWYAVGGFKPVSALQLVAKYEDFRRSAISAGQRNRAWSAGVNGFPVLEAVRVSAFYVSRRTGSPGVRRSVVEAQAQVKF